ncbi:MAG: hypothetical protein AAF660_15810 [Pseudomonadota bacterium]
MPISQRFISEGKGVVFELQGVITSEEFFDTFVSYFNAPDDIFLPLRFSLTDLTDVDSVELSNQDIADLGLVARESYQRNPDSVVAFAAPSDLTYGLAKVWSAWLGPQSWTSNLLRDRASAERWLRTTVSERFGLHHIEFDDRD